MPRISHDTQYYDLTIYSISFGTKYTFLQHDVDCQPDHSRSSRLQ
jgi:hypothetical protein